MVCVIRNCGREIPDDAIWCPWCGKKQVQAPRTKTANRQKGTGSIYKHGNGYAAELHFKRDGKTIQRKRKYGFRSKALANAWLESMLGTGIEKKTMTISQAWETLKKTRKWQEISRSKQGQYTTAYNRLEKIHFRVIGTIPFEELQKLVDAAPGDYYPHKDIKTVLGKLYNVAATNEALDKDQDKTNLLELPPLPNSKREAFTADEVKKIWAAYTSGDKMAAYALILCYTGMRPGEMFDVKLENIDIEKQCIIGGIKTEAGINREIPIATAIVPIIEKVMQNCTHGLADGCREHFYENWNSENWGIRPHMTAYSGRRTLATAMEKAEISMFVRKRILGHKVDDITELYTTIDFAQKLEAVEKATAIFSPE